MFVILLGTNHNLYASVIKFLHLQPAIGWNAKKNTAYIWKQIT